ncbi:hypothetical protein [Kribbella sp. C-35]|uniref:hypothetical protein n=1 Tax=Kribbella sp. C-35 TaxID=2789276 RepID=UPI003979584A
MNAVTPEQYQERLLELFAKADEVQAILDDPQRERFAVKPGTALFGDDQGSMPYYVSHDVNRLLGVGFQHVHALGCLIRSGALHPSAPFTLARAAIETGAMAYWVLSPAARRDRILRRLQLARKDIMDGDSAATGAGIPVNRPRDERLTELEDLSERVCGTRTVPGLNPSAIIEQVESQLQPEQQMHQLLAWKVCSGFTHGRLWPETSLLKQEIIQTDGDVVRLRLTNDLSRVLWVTTAGWRVLNAALRGLLFTHPRLAVRCTGSSSAGTAGGAPTHRRRALPC